MKHVKLLVATSIMMLWIGMSAQPRGDRPTPPTQKTPEEIALMETDKMNSEVNLTEKQYKKVYKLIKKDQAYRQSQMEKQFSDGMPPQGGPGGMPGPGGMAGGMMGGGPGGMGGPGGGSMGGGRPPMGNMGNGPRPEGGRPEMVPGGEVITEEYLEKQDRKLKKILTEEQYLRWRSKHPVEHFELPPLGFDKMN